MGENEFTQRSAEQTIKKGTQRQFAGRHPQTREACACLSVIQPVDTEDTYDVLF